MPAESILRFDVKEKREARSSERRRTNDEQPHNGIRPAVMIDSAAMPALADELFLQDPISSNSEALRFHLLTWSRLESSTIRLKHVGFDLADLMPEVISGVLATAWRNLNSG